jgi:hypothetical protein
MALPLSLLLLPLFAERVVADAPAQPSRHVLAPTPREQMRELSTDRPDTTESPFTVDAGHVQVEIDAVSVEREQGSAEVAVATTNLKLGLTTFADLQLILEPHRRAGGRRGIGDLTVRTKLNLLGNDGGAAAFAVMPFVSLPTAARGLGAGHTEGGVSLPLGFDAPLDLDVTTMLELDVARHDDRYGLDLIATCSVGHSLVGELGGYVEVASSTPLESPDALELGLNGGLTLGIGRDVALDGGGRVGLTEAAPDLALFVGGSARY